MRMKANWRGISVLVLTAKEVTEEDRARLNGSVARITEESTHTQLELLEEIR